MTNNKRSAVEKLAEDFRRWGYRPTLRIQRMTKQYGVLCHSEKWSDGKRG